MSMDAGREASLTHGPDVYKSRACMRRKKYDKTSLCVGLRHYTLSLRYAYGRYEDPRQICADRTL